MNKRNDYRVVVGIDFGTTYSGFAYAHIKNPRDIYSHIDWQEFAGRFKTPTALSYDEEYKNAQSWGFPALAKRPSGSTTKKKKQMDKKPVELFKLHLGKMSNKPPLPSRLNFKKAIADYLHEMGKIVKQTVASHWKVDFHSQVLLILTVPAEFDDNAISIMRDCAFKAGLLNDKSSKHLKFTTEPEAAAIYCMKYLKEHNMLVGSTFMVVDCGGGTVDLTTRELLEGDRLSEITERTGDFCGGSFVDQEFLKFLERMVGSSAIRLLKENQYGQLQYMVQEFCKSVKTKFTGVRSEFQNIGLELDEICPALSQYCKGQYLDNMEEAEWSIELNYEDVKGMFDPVIERILDLIDSQLNSSEDCSTLFMVGGFSESKYLQSRIKKEFSGRVKIISIPPQPICAIAKGAALYGLREEIVSTRVLKWTYGTDIARKWRVGDPESKNIDGSIITFERLAKRGTQMAVDEKVVSTFSACSMEQSKMGLDLYATQKDDAEFCDESHVKSLGKWSIDLPASKNEEDRSISYTMTFGSVEIEISAVNSGTGDRYETSLDLDI